MERLTAILLLTILVAVLGLGLLTWQADQHAEARAETQACIARVQATAVVAVLAPDEVVDQQGRVEAIRALSAQLDAC